MAAGDIRLTADITVCHIPLLNWK